MEPTQENKRLRAVLNALTKEGRAARSEYVGIEGENRAAKLVTKNFRIFNPLEASVCQCSSKREEDCALASHLSLRYGTLNILLNETLESSFSDEAITRQASSW
jgi:hypothetical protein